MPTNNPIVFNGTIDDSEGICKDIKFGDVYNVSIIAEREFETKLKESSLSKQAKAGT